LPGDGRGGPARRAADAFAVAVFGPVAFPVGVTRRGVVIIQRTGNHHDDQAAAEFDDDVVHHDDHPHPHPDAPRTSRVTEAAGSRLGAGVILLVALGFTAATLGAGAVLKAPCV